MTSLKNTPFFKQNLRNTHLNTQKHLPLLLLKRIMGDPTPRDKLDNQKMIKRKEMINTFSRRKSVTDGITKGRRLKRKIRRKQGNG